MHICLNSLDYTGNLALSRPTQQISLGYSAGASWKAVDGKTDSDFDNGGCTHTGTSRFPWWSVSFSQISPVVKVVITNRGDCCCKYLFFIYSFSSG